MKRSLNILFYILPALLWVVMSGCSDAEQTVRIPTPGDTPVSLEGALTRNDGVNGSKIYLKAFTDGAPYAYLSETPLSFQSGLSATPTQAVFAGAPPYYPLGDETIRFFAFSGHLTSDNKMILKAGNGSDYDAVLSNYGQRSGDADVDPSYETNGTPGSSSQPALLLQFRHVMTQLTVEIVVNKNEKPVPVDPAPRNVNLTMDGVVAGGTYSIRAPRPTATESNPANLAQAQNANQLYTIHLNDNYLVPTGEVLSGKTLKSLTIDDYTATAQDLAGFVIDNAVQGETGDLRLLPGYSYKLTITVERLGVSGIKLTPQKWQVRDVTNIETGYDPYMLNLDFSSGRYANSGTGLINKVVLHTSDNKTYVGEPSDGDTRVSFVKLPANGVIAAELYTSQGMLLSTDISNEYNYAESGSTLALTLSEGGMKTASGATLSSENDPYLITTPLQFLNVSKEPGAHYRQDVVIGMNNLNIDNFTGLGDFSGTYDGNGNWIAELDLKGTGLFSSNSGTLRGIRIITGTVDATGNATAGAICASNSGTIVGCINEAQVINASATAGGICGSNSGTVIGCVNTGNVRRAPNVGGICGTNTNNSGTAIAACLNIGSLNPKAATLGAMTGTTSDSADETIRTSFWLVGSAEHDITTVGKANGAGNVGMFDVSPLDPQKLRNTEISADPAQDLPIVNRLNNELAKYPQWSGRYEYVMDPVKTGITWPAPMKK